MEKKEKKEKEKEKNGKGENHLDIIKSNSLPKMHPNEANH